MKELDILTGSKIKHQNTMTIAGEEIEVDPLEGEGDPSSVEYVDINSSLI
jgi:hypothetical protein